jgi:hypothetical protein
LAITASEVRPATLDLLDHVVATHEVGACVLALLLFVACAITSIAFRLAGAVRSTVVPRTIWIGMLGIDAEKQRELDRLIELGERDLLEQRNAPRRCCTARGSTSPALARYF